MSKIELPPLPEPDVMCDCGGDYFTVAKLRARDRQIVELCAAKLELPTQNLLLLCGETSSQELRTVKAVLRHRAAAIRALLDEKKGDDHAT